MHPVVRAARDLAVVEGIHSLLAAVAAVVRMYQVRIVLVDMLQDLVRTDSVDLVEGR